MKKLSSFLAALMGSSLILSGCGKTDKSSQSEEQDAPVHSHVDADHNHYCDECLEKFSDHAYPDGSHVCTYCGEETNCVDIDIDGSCDICHKSWSSSSLELFNNYLGEPLPYFAPTSNFVEKQGYYIEATFNRDATEELVNLFLATGKYTDRIGAYLDKEAHYLEKICTNDPYSKISVMVLYNETNSTTFVDAELKLVELKEFPTEKVLSVLASDDEVPLFPTDGETFLFEKTKQPNYCVVVYDGSAAAYLNQLKNAGYYIDYSMIDYYLYPAYRCISGGRTIVIQITDLTTEVQVEFKTEAAPNESEWDEFIKNGMTTLFDEVLPFANANFEVKNKEASLEDIEYHGYFQIESYFIDAFPYAVEAFRTDIAFEEEYEQDGNFYTFTKSMGYCLEKVVVSCQIGITVISFMKVFPTYTSFPIEQINYCLGSEYVDLLPEAAGTSYYLYYENAHPNIANLTVYGSTQNYNDYLTLLESNDYILTTLDDGWIHAVGSKKSIEMYLFDSTRSTSEESGPFYKLEIHLFKAPDVFHEFPLDAVIEELSEGILFSCTEPTGDTFTVTYPYGKGTGASDIKIDIIGGDKAAYLSALAGAGYEYDEMNSCPGQYDAYSNHKSHLCVYIYESASNSEYSVEYGALFEF